MSMHELRICYTFYVHNPDPEHDSNLSHKLLTQRRRAKLFSTTKGDKHLTLWINSTPSASVI